ncbi:MAG TPA: MBL fold metallo-hydrolase [Vicinamibacteria bacterium]|jgi:glyoxylase-like metal-dependent hydrolase (beta-lactamase superfamily II)
MLVTVVPVGPLQCNCTILGDPGSGEAIVVDPGDEVEKVLAALRRHGLRCAVILNTHAHIDHVGANHALREASGARLMMHEADLPLYDNLRVQSQWLGGLIPEPPRAELDGHVDHGDRVGAGEVAVQVLHTPGHTPGSICFRVGEEALVLTGDTLFAGSIGRTDLWGGDFEQEIASIRRHLLPLDAATRVIPGHGPETTIGWEKQHNPFLNER